MLTHDRFVRASRRRWEGLRPLATLLTAAVLAAVGGWVLFASPFLDIRSVRVTGVRELTATQVVDAAAVAAGRPLAGLDTAAVHRRVAALPRVAAVRVSRVWPHTVRISVVERSQAAVVRVRGENLLVDAGGVTFATVATAPAGLPVIAGDHGPAALRAAVAVLHALAPAVGARVVSVTAPSPDAVTLTLQGKVSVVWGSPDASARKAEVLAALMRHRAVVYDVSAPEAPTTRDRP